MTKTYAVPDLHGRYDLLELALERIESSPSGGRIVFLGDYVDRGPSSRQVVERLMAGPAKPGWTWTCLKGNHEKIMADALAGRPSEASWMQNGGGFTLVSYGHPERGRIDLSHVPADHAAWIESLPLIHADGMRVFVHAGVDPDLALEDQAAHTLLWRRPAHGLDYVHPAGHVVHGHTPVEEPDLLAGRTNLDTHAWLTGRLHVGVFDDAVPGGPVSVWSVTGRPA